MQRTVYILFSLLISLVVYATKVDLQPSSSTLHTAMPNDTLYISQTGTYRVKITEIGKYHIEQTIPDTVDFKLEANNIKDQRVKQNIPSQDTLQVSFKDIKMGRKITTTTDHILSLKNDTCNIQLSFAGTCTMNTSSNIGYNLPYCNVLGKSPSFNLKIEDSFHCQPNGASGHQYLFIQTSLDNNDTLHYQINSTSTSRTGGISNANGYVYYENSNMKEVSISQGKNSVMFIKNSTIQANDYSWHNAVISSKGKIFINDATLQGTSSLTFIGSADTIFIDETNNGQTKIDAIIGSKRNTLNETQYSRVVVNNASFIREITTMADVYNGNINLLCPSPFVRDSQTHADINVFGGKIGQITNVAHTRGNNTLCNNRNLHIYGGTIGGGKEWTKTGIHLGYTYYFDVPQTGTLLNDTLNLYGGKIQVPKDYSLINFTDNTVINVYHKDNPSKRTQFQFHPKHTPSTGDYFNYIALIGDNIIGDSIYWEIGDMKHLVGIKSQLITESHLGCNRKAFRLVYKKSQQPNDSLVVGVAAKETHYFGDLLDTYDIVHIYPAFKRNIHFVHTLDETWEYADSTYEEGFGKAKLPRVIYAGKTFKGWFTEPEGGIKVDSISHLQTGDVTLYTQWGPGQDIIYSDFENNWFCNTGAVHIHHWGDLNNVIESEIKPLEGHNTKAVHSNIIKNNGSAQTCFFLRNNYPSQVYIYNNAPTQYMDLRSTTGISFLHKGVSVYVQIGDDDYRVPQHDELTLVNIPWGQFRTIGRPINLEKVNYIDFNPNRVEQGEFWIDDIIFTQGDIYPVESIKIDTVPNKYLYTKNPDLLDIPLPATKDSTQLFLYPKFTPSDATYQSVIWSSKDPSIATVDIYGRVNAISHGQTYIYCQSVMHPEVKDSILVGVKEGGITYNLNGVSISNQLPTKYDYEHPVAIPTPQPINDFYTFHGWHTDSITGAVVDSASYHQFGNLKAHTLYAEFTREIPGAAITIMQNRIVAVQNPNNYDALKEARYVWKFNNQTLPSKKMFVEVGRPIPEGTYHVTMHIDDEMPIQLERYIDASVNQNTENNNFTLYPNPIKAGNLAYLIGRYDSITLFDMNGQPINTPISDNGIITAPMQTGMYVLKIIVDNNTYSIKFIVI
ncbi:MAG: InlB B-repeat-containing protein [Paludibacteraceae bacterium]|nr:InlB B-repeat-containing protein [Paludibacteraceae bacterium]